MSKQFDSIINRGGTDSIKWEWQFVDEMPHFRPMQPDPMDPAQVLPLWVADMDFRSPQTVIDALVARAEHGIFGYTMPSDDYYAAIINWMQSQHNWHVDRDWIFTTPGVVPTLNLLIQTYTQPGDGVIIQTPVYHPFYTAVENNSRTLLRNPLRLADGRYTIDFDDLARLAAQPDARMLILCSPHNPVGRVWTSAELRRMADICLANDVLIVSDEIHHDLIFSWASFTTFGVACPDALARTIICTAPSKTFNVPGLKTANTFIADPTLREQFAQTLRRQGLFGGNAFGLTALATAYNTGAAWLADVMAYIEANYQLLAAFTAEHWPDVQLIEPEGTYLAWLDCRQVSGASDLAGRLRDEARVALSDGAGFGEDGVGFLRLNLACPRAILVEALTRMRQILG